MTRKSSPATAASRSGSELFDLIEIDLEHVKEIFAMVSAISRRLGENDDMFIEICPGVEVLADMVFDSLDSMSKRLAELRAAGGGQ